jgi:hypothetical protein
VELPTTASILANKGLPDADVDNSREDLNLQLDNIVMPQMIFAKPFERY